MRDLVERAELDAAHSRIRLLVHALEQERQARQEADRAQVQWHNEACRRAGVIRFLRSELLSLRREMVKCGAIKE